MVYCQFLSMNGLSFIWFTWGPDAACLKQSVASVRAVAPDAALNVRFDPDHPLPDCCVWDLAASGVSVRPSSDTHGGNLNGAPHVVRQLGEIAAAGDGLVVKLDADTTVHGLDWLPSADPADLAAAGFEGGPKQPWAGPCYAVSAVLARRLRDTLANHLQHPDPTLLLSRACPEDATIWRLMKHTSTQRVLRWPTSHLFQGFQYPAAPADQLHTACAAAFPRYRQAQVITWGNRGQIPGEPVFQRQFRAQIMADYRAT